MRIAPKLLLLVLVMMVAFPPAPAAPEVQNEGFLIQQEDFAGHHCPVIRTGDNRGCKLHFSGEESFVAHVFGIEAVASDCNLDLEARIDEDAEGYVYDGESTGDATHGCTGRLCNLPWPIRRVSLDPHSNGLLIGLVLCKRSSTGATSECELKLPLVDGGTHDYEIQLDPKVSGVPRSGGQSCELRDGKLRIESGGPDFEPPLEEHHEIEVFR
jgi:hypothetical protein